MEPRSRRQTLGARAPSEGVRRGSFRSPSGRPSRSARPATGGRSSSRSEPAASSRFDLYPGATLVAARSDTRIHRAARRRRGSRRRIDAFLVDAGRRADRDRLPWLAPEERIWRRLRPVRAGTLVAAIERAGVVPLALAPLGHRALATSAAAPRSHGGRLARLKVRTDVDAATSSISSASRRASASRCRLPTPRAAFRAGTLDAQEGTLATIAAARLGSTARADAR